MPRMTTADQLTYWKSQIRRGIAYQEKFAEKKRWKDYYNYYWGKYKSDVYAVNKVFSMLRSLIPRVYFRNPRLIVSPKRPEFEMRAVVVQAVNNLLIKELMMKETTKKIIQDAFFCNRGIVKIGYDRQYGSIPDYMSKAFPSEEAIEYDVTVKPDMPWVLRTNPEHFIVPWGADSLKNIPWVAHKIVRLLEDVRKDPIYENTAKLKGGYERELRGVKEAEVGISETTLTSQTETIKEYQVSDEAWVEIWEIRDLKHGKILALNLDHDKFLRRPVDDDLQGDGAPFEDVCFNPDNDVYWGPSDMRILEPLQNELNEVRTQMSKHRKINLLKFLFNDKFTPEQVQKFLSGDVGGAEIVPDLTRDDVVVIQPGEPIQLGNDAMGVERDIRESVGFARTEEGEYAGPPRRTKAEIQAVQQAHWIRIDERRDIVADFLIRVMEKVNTIIFERWDQARVAPIVGPDNAIHWVQFTGPEIAGDYDLSIDIDTGKPVTTEIKRAEAEHLLNMLTANPILVEHINPVELTRNVLKLYDWVDTDKVLMSQQAQQGQGGPPQIEQLGAFASFFGRGGR